jgi:hypothetical protein
VIFYHQKGKDQTLDQLPEKKLVDFYNRESLLAHTNNKEAKLLEGSGRKTTTNPKTARHQFNAANNGDDNDASGNHGGGEGFGGMDGSGKTGLCISLLEEAALDGIPAIFIDPKGDLGNLMLTFPDLSPVDIESLEISPIRIRPRKSDITLT